MVAWVLALSARAEPCFEVVDGRIAAGEAAMSFVAGKAELVAQAASAVAGIACRLEAEPELSLQIAVHTDAQGSGAFNLRMSQARAEAVGAALEALGVDAARLHPAGFGETRPIAPNDTEAGRDANRRVELWVDPARWQPPPAPAAEVPAPQPAPAAPAPVTDPCPSWRQVWEARCGHRDSCTVEEPPARAAALAARCLGGTEPVLQDGEARYVRLPGGVVTVTAAPGGGSTLGLSSTLGGPN
jgi:hypothetical protein